MTKFNKENFNNDGMYLVYYPDGLFKGERKFVWRSKKSGARAELNGVITFLVKNFEVEEWFARADAGESPLPIAESKGYILPHIRKWIKQAGFPVTPEGYKAWQEVQRAASEARYALIRRIG